MSSEKVVSLAVYRNKNICHQWLLGMKQSFLEYDWACIDDQTRTALVDTLELQTSLHQMGVLPISIRFSSSPTCEIIEFSDRHHLINFKVEGQSKPHVSNEVLDSKQLSDEFDKNIFLTLTFNQVSKAEHLYLKRAASQKLKELDHSADVFAGFLKQNVDTSKPIDDSNPIVNPSTLLTANLLSRLFTLGYQLVSTQTVDRRLDCELLLDSQLVELSFDYQVLDSAWKRFQERIRIMCPDSDLHSVATQPQ